MPIVSVIIPSYNHEQYIQDCIQSVLDQTFQDFEIIITDDGSTDHSVDVIKGFTDPRIKLYKFEKNRGASVAANNCLRYTSGKYIAMLSSDDAWYPQKLAVQVKYLDEHPDIPVVFGKVDWINENGALITNISFPYLNVFDVKNRSRFEWLRYFFEQGNCLCHPCSLIRRECYSEVGVYNPAFASMPDFDLWIRICLKYDIVVLDQKLIRFRRIGEDSNASGDNITSRIRNRFEYLQELNHYLKVRKADELLLIFPNAARYGEVRDDLIPYFLGRIAVDAGWDFKMLWGLELIYNLLQDEKLAKILNDEYDFSYLDFINLASKCDFFRISLLSQPVNLNPLPVHASVVRKFLSASKRYAKELYSIALDVRK